MAAPESFGRYQVKQLLGQGAMGSVYLAEDPVISRKVAIKVISAPFGQAGKDHQVRFEREFKAAGTLSHPNIVTIHDVGTHEGQTFVAMEYIDGQSLEEIFDQEGTLSLDTVATLLDQICSGLDYAHERGIVHRDIKPANIIVTTDGRAKITDFGVAKVLDVTATGLTRDGTAIGTPSYMSPEQAKGYPVQGSSDQFSLAVLVYRFVTGERPFTGDSLATLVYKIVHEVPIALNVLNRAVAPRVSAAVMKALDKDPTQRFETCSAFAAAFRAGVVDGPVALPADPNAQFAETVFQATQVSGADPPAPPAAPASAPAPRRGARRWRTPIVATVVLAVGVLIWAGAGSWLAPRGEVGTASPGTPAVPVAPGPEFRGQTRVESTPPGASIWVDGADLGLVAPALVPLAGDVGQEVQLQLRRDGAVAASITLALGTELPAQWTPESQRTLEPTPPEPGPRAQSSAPQAAGSDVPAPQSASAAEPAGSRPATDPPPRSGNGVATQSGDGPAAPCRLPAAGNCGPNTASTSCG